MQEPTLCPKPLPQSLRMLNDSRLIVGQHQGRDHRTFRKNLIRRQPMLPPRSDGQIIQRPSPGPGQGLQGFGHTRVFGLTCEQAGRGKRLGKAPQRKIGGFCPAGGKNHLFGPDGHERADLLTGPVDRPTTQTSEPMQRRGIAIKTAQIGQHGLKDPGIQRRCGVVIQIDHSADAP